MKNIKHLERLQQLHHRIQNENTGTPLEMARYMNISTRSFHNLIAELKILGAKIAYSRSRQTYYYFNDFTIEMRISLKVIQEGKSRRVYGGSYLFQENRFPARFLH